MANINSIMSTNSASSASSIYGNRNVLTGLASGMDTEAMIENSISGYKTKIAQLQQQQTKYAWKQDAFRDIIDTAAAFNDKYTSYTSSTNLMSAAFFTGNAVTSAQGVNAAAVSATGKASSNIQITSVNQLATAARYTVSASDLGAIRNSYSTTGNAIGDLNSISKRSLISGGLTISYGGKDIELEFDKNDEADIFDEASGADRVQWLADRIKTKLQDIDVSAKRGTMKASELVDVTVNNGEISFSSKNGDNSGADVWISGASGDFKSQLGVESKSYYDYKNGVPKSFSVGNKALSETKSVGDMIDGAGVEVTLDGVTKTIRMNLTKDNDGNYTGFDAASINDQLKTAFGAGKVEFKFDNNQVSFSAASDDSALTVKSSAAGKALGFADGMSSYVNTGKKLGELLGVDANGKLIGLDAATDKDGNEVTDSDGNALYDFTINGKSVGQFSKNSSIQDVMDAINSKSDVNISYSRMTNQFTFTNKNTGANGEIDFGDSGLAARLFTSNGDGDKSGGSFTAGQDSIMNVNIDGTLRTITRSSNTVDLDGMSVTLKDTFNNNLIDGQGRSVRMIGAQAFVVNENGQFVDNQNNVISDYPITEAILMAHGVIASTPVNQTEAISFKTTSNADPIVDAIKSFVNEYNDMAKKVHDAFATQPAEKNSSSHTKYEPLTDEDKADMSETAIKNYEEKAKQGILFGDSDLSAFYSRLTDIVSRGTTAADLKAIGIETTYSGGVTQLKLNESDLRTALENDPDKVKNVFTNTSSSTGLMTRMKTTLDSYASTSYSEPGILVNKAGTKLNSKSLLTNALQTQSDNLQTQIERWQTKMSSKVDYYTRQFTALEKLMSTMNSQTSALSSLMGGY